MDAHLDGRIQKYQRMIYPSILCPVEHGYSVKTLSTNPRVWCSSRRMMDSRSQRQCVDGSSRYDQVEPEELGM